jgi:hypothetical protein
LWFECPQRNDDDTIYDPDAKPDFHGYHPLKKLYICLIHVDLNWPDPDSRQYYYTEWPSLVYNTIVPAEYRVDWISDNSDAHGAHWNQPMWLRVGSNWSKLPPWSQPLALDTLCLLDYSNLSAGKIVAMNYSYFQIGSQDVNGVGDRTIVKFHLSTKPGDQQNVLDWANLPAAIKSVIVLIEWSF